MGVLLAVAVWQSVRPDQAADRSVRLSVPSVSTFTAAVMAFVVATAAQLGTAFGVAALLLVAALTTGIPERGSVIRRSPGMLRP